MKGVLGIVVIVVVMANPRKVSKAKDPKSSCTHCKKAEPDLKCSQCDFKYHHGCVDVDDKVYQLYTAGKSVGFTWSCVRCRSTIPQESRLNDIEKKLEQSKSRNEEIISMITSLGNKFEKMEEMVLSKTSKSPPEDSQRSSISLTAAISGSDGDADRPRVQTKIYDEEEMKQRDRKKMNICLFNLPESESFDESESYAEDMKKLKEVLIDKEGFDPNHVKRAYRVTRYKTPGKTRPMVIVFTNETTRLNVLRMNDLFYSKDGGEKVRLYTGIDKTKRQVEEHKRLVSELVSRRNAGEDDLVIRSGKIVKKMPFLPPPQSFWG